MRKVKKRKLKAESGMSYRGVVVELLINTRDLEKADVEKKSATEGIYHHPGQVMDWHSTERMCTHVVVSVLHSSPQLQYCCLPKGP